MAHLRQSWWHAEWSSLSTWLDLDSSVKIHCWVCPERHSQKVSWGLSWGLPMGTEHQRSTLTTDTMWPDTWHTPVAIPSQKWQAVLKLRDGINPAFLKMLLWDNFVRATQIPSCTMWLFTLARSAPTWSKSALQKGAFPNVVPASLGSSSNWKQKKSDDWRDSDRQ